MEQENYESNQPHRADHGYPDERAKSPPMVLEFSQLKVLLEKERANWERVLAGHVAGRRELQARLAAREEAMEFELSQLRQTSKAAQGRLEQRVLLLEDAVERLEAENGTTLAAFKLEKQTTETLRGRVQALESELRAARKHQDRGGGGSARTPPPPRGASPPERAAGKGHGGGRALAGGGGGGVGKGGAVDTEGSDDLGDLEEGLRGLLP